MKGNADIFNMTKGSSVLDDIVGDENFNVDYNGESEISDDPIVNIDLGEVNTEASEEAEEITTRLSGYYFDQKYIDTHPYVPVKIKCEMKNIRRLLKMLTINEIAQDSLIKNISFNAGKGSLYSSLTSLQNSTLAIQAQLNNLTQSLEDIFQKMQDECEKTWADKDKEEKEDGTMVVRGSREFIKMLTERQEKQEAL